VPVLIDRQDTWSGNPVIIVSRTSASGMDLSPGVELGRHVIGSEVRKSVGGLIFSRSQRSEVRGQKERPEDRGGGVWGGRLIGLYAAALDTALRVFW